MMMPAPVINAPNMRSSEQRVSFSKIDRDDRLGWRRSRNLGENNCQKSVRFPPQI